MTVNVAGGANTGAHVVTLKSVYTDDSVYFLAAWNDPTESLRREPWVKQANNTWKQLKDPDGVSRRFSEQLLSQGEQPVPTLAGQLLRSDRIL